MRTVPSKTLKEITAEWDALAPVRHRQISSGEDISYWHVITPSIIDIIKTLTPTRILDAGCGTGLFTNQLAQFAPEVVGVDPSNASINLARSSSLPGIKFACDTIENFSTSNILLFDIVIANMVLMDTISFKSFLDACKKVLSPAGSFIFSITHPCFWPDYYGYVNASWYHYEQELIVEAPFRISCDKTGALISTHIHRPLSAYFDAFREAGFFVSSLYEPRPPAHVSQEYKNNWKIPRYLVGACFIAT